MNFALARDGSWCSRAEGASSIKLSPSSASQRSGTERDFGGALSTAKTALHSRQHTEILQVELHTMASDQYEHAPQSPLRAAYLPRHDPGPPGPNHRYFQLLKYC